MPQFLFIANQQDDTHGKTISAFDVAKSRLELTMWGLYENTPHRKIIAVGDTILIYIAGTGKLGMHFIATASVKKIVENKKEFERALFNLTTPLVSAAALENIHFFETPVSIKKIKHNLDFIPQKTNKWGCVLQRGVKKISEKDFSTIVQFARCANK